MSRFFKSVAGLAACSMLLGWSAMSNAADPPTGLGFVKSNVLVARSFPAKKLQGMNVRNSQGEKLGTIEDVVINVETGKVSYAALSYGGFLGIGDKLFAVPWSEFKFDHGKDEMFFVLDFPKDKLKAAPGFDKSDWPNFADPHWADRIDEYYRDVQKNVTTKNVTK